jgi:hypothetical protein
MPAAPIAPVMSEHDRKIREFEEKIVALEQEYSAFENKYSRLEGTYGTIESKMDGNINEATRERLEEMLDEVQERMDETQEKMDETQEKMDEVNEEREEYENEYVDEDIISEIKNLPGFDNNFEKFEGSKDFETHNAPQEINIDIIDEMSEKYAEISSEQREQRRRYRRESKHNVNFCSGAKIDSFCCHSAGENPEYMINDDGLKTKWCATERHSTEIAHPYWIIIDLGSVETFNYVQITKCSPGHSGWGDHGNKDLDMSAWRIEVCQNQLDKTNNVWKEFNRETNDKSSIYEKQFEPVAGRYIRLLIDAGEADPNHKHGHVRIHGFKVKMRDETGEDIADFTKKAKIESCSHHNNGRNELPENILNDVMKQKWYATHRHFDRVDLPHWVIIDFGDSKTFNHLRMIKASEGEHVSDRGRKHYDMSAWRMEASDDKENWTEFNKETHDQSSIYIKTFEQPVSGRYVRLLIDAAEADPKNKHGHVRIYDLRIEMLSEKFEDKVVTFDDIIAIAPFAKKETLDKLADKLTDIDNFAKLKEVGKFLSHEAITKLILKAFEKDDFNAIFALAPYAPKETIEKIALDLDSELEFDKIKALSPYLGKEAIAGIIISGGKLDMRKLRELAPFLGSALIDEIVQRMF